MSSIEPTGGAVPTEAAAPTGKPVRRPFRKSMTNMPSRDEMARQMKVASDAWAELRDRDAVMAFLNSHHDGLGGRPLDVATASDEGLAAVRAALTAHAAG